MNTNFDVEVPSRWEDSFDAVGVRPELAAVLVLGAAIRLYRLGSESLWLDEAFSVVVASRNSFGYLLFELPTSDPHPPLYNVFLKAWMAAFGTSEVSVRFPSALFGVGSIVAGYYLADELFDRRTALVASVLLAVSPFQVWYAQEARAYTMLVFFTLVSTYALVRLANAATFDWRPAALYVVATVLLVYTHVFAGFVVLAQNAYVLGRLVLPGETLRMPLRRWVPVQAAAGLLSLPWVLELYHRAVALDAGAGSPISWIPEPTPEFFWNAYLLFTGGKGLMGGLDALTLFPALLTGVVLVGGLARYRGDGGGTLEARVPDAPQVGLLVALVAVPVVVPYWLSLEVTPILVLRYTIPAAAAFSLLVARGVTGFDRRYVSYLLLAALVVALVFPLPGYYATDQKEQWREAGNWVESGVGSNDVVVVSPNWLWRPFEYYYDGEAPVERVWSGASGEKFRQVAAGHDDVYLVVSHASQQREDEIVSSIEQGASVGVEATVHFRGVTVYAIQYGEQ